MKELQLGIMNKKQLAEWFGVKYKTFCQSKEYLQKRLTELKEFANFKIVNNKEIEILEIYEPIYVKNGEKINKEIKEMIIKDVKPNIPFTCTQLGDKYYYLLHKKYNGEQRTYIARTIKARNELWGKPALEGKCRKEVVKMYRGLTPKDNKYELLTPEEKITQKIIAGKLFDTMTFNFEDLVIKVKDKEIRKEIIQKLEVSDITYKRYIKRLSEAFNCDWIVTATVIDEDNLAINSQELQDYYEEFNPKESNEDFNF